MIKKYKLKNKTFYLLQLSYTEETGERHQRKYRFDKQGQRITSERVARLLEFEYLNELKNRIQDEHYALTFLEWHEKFLESIRLTFKSSTVKQYDGDLRKWLVPELSLAKLGELRKRDIHKFIFDTLPSRGATPNTQNKMRKTLNRIFESALEEGLISKNPVVGIKVKVPPPKQEVLNTQEVEKLLELGKSREHTFYYHWALALLTGMRNGELYALRWRDVDLVTQTIHITLQWTSKDGLHATKSNRNRVFPISDQLKDLLLELKNKGPFSEKLTSLKGQDGEFDDFILPRASEWRHGEQSKVVKSFCRLIGVTEVSFHSLRSTFITNMLAQGVSLPKVMALVGHSRVSTTNEYLRLAGVDVKGSTEALGYSLPVTGDGTLKFRTQE